nr:DUF5110 domain-containing protein [Actinopolymorpha pittospori]
MGRARLPVAAQANATGFGPTRPLVLEYPDDPATWGDQTKYQFLAGQDLLVAPVYSDTDTRDGIYLPQGTWVDYWTGRTYQGPTTLNDYPAPLSTLPLFVKGGAIVPMFPDGTTDWQQGKNAGQLDLDVYPQGDTTFTAYEDDGHTRDHRQGSSAEQTFTVKAPERGRGNIQVRIGAMDGTYTGKPDARNYFLHVHTGSAPEIVRAGNTRLTQVASAAELNSADSGWYYAADERGGTVHVKTPRVATNTATQVDLYGTSAIGGVDRSTTVSVPYASLAAAFNNTAITAEVDPESGDFDGGGSSYIAERLAAQGATTGGTVTHDGVAFTWPDADPGTPDNVAAQGQTIAVQGQGSHLAFLGSEAGFTSGPVTIHYADGTTSMQSLGFPNWCCADTSGYGAEPAITTYGKNIPTGPAYPTTAYHVFYNDVTIEAGKQVVAVTLPQSGAIHIFATAFTKTTPG